MKKHIVIAMIVIGMITLAQNVNAQCIDKMQKAKGTVEYFQKKVSGEDTAWVGAGFVMPRMSYLTEGFYKCVESLKKVGQPVLVVMSNNDTVVVDSIVLSNIFISICKNAVVDHSTSGQFTNSGWNICEDEIHWDDHFTPITADSSQDFLKYPFLNGISLRFAKVTMVNGVPCFNLVCEFVKEKNETPTPETEAEKAKPEPEGEATTSTTKKNSYTESDTTISRYHYNEYDNSSMGFQAQASMSYGQPNYGYQSYGGGYGGGCCAESTGGSWNLSGDPLHIGLALLTGMPGFALEYQQNSNNGCCVQAPGGNTYIYQDNSTHYDDHSWVYNNNHNNGNVYGHDTVYVVITPEPIHVDTTFGGGPYDGPADTVLIGGGNGGGPGGPPDSSGKAINKGLFVKNAILNPKDSKVAPVAEVKSHATEVKSIISNNPKTFAAFTEVKPVVKPQIVNNGVRPTTVKNEVTGSQFSGIKSDVKPVNSFATATTSTPRPKAVVSTSDAITGFTYANYAAESSQPSTRPNTNVNYAAESSQPSTRPNTNVNYAAESSQPSTRPNTNVNYAAESSQPSTRPNTNVNYAAESSQPSTRPNTNVNYAAESSQPSTRPNTNVNYAAESSQPSTRPNTNVNYAAESSQPSTRPNTNVNYAAESSQPSTRPNTNVNYAAESSQQTTRPQPKQQPVYTGKPGGGGAKHYSSK